MTIREFLLLFIGAALVTIVVTVTVEIFAR